MFFRVNFILSDTESETVYFYAVSLRKVIDYLIRIHGNTLIRMTYDELEKTSDEDLVCRFIENSVKWLNIEIINSIEVINLENGLKSKNK